MTEYSPTTHGDLADHLRGRGVLSHVEDVTALANEGALHCPHCDQPVHADNWRKHHETKHSDLPFTEFHVHYAAQHDAPTQLPVSVLVTDGGTQSRSLIDLARVNEYAERMTEGDVFPALVVFYDGSRYHLADGFHRVSAAKQAKIGTLPCDIRQGTQRDAIWYSTGANARHGLPRTPQDKRRAVQRLLDDPEWSVLSDREIARHCVVSHGFVSNIRKEVSVHDGQIAPAPTRTVTRNGTVYEQKVRTKPALREDAPNHVQEAVEGGDLGTSQGNQLTAELSTVSTLVRQIAHKYGVTDVETIRLLKRLDAAKAETVEVVLASGYIQIADDEDAVHITAPAAQLEKAIAQRAEHHRKIAGQAKPQPEDGKYAYVVLALPYRMSADEIAKTVNGYKLLAVGDYANGAKLALQNVAGWKWVAK